jgi:hypothetical protein
MVRLCAGHERSLIAFHAFTPRAFDSSQPPLSRSRRQVLLAHELQNEFAQNVQVVPVTQYVLQPLEYALRHRVLLRQEAFERVTKAFRRHADFVPSRGAVRFSPLPIRLMNLGQSLEREQR